MTIRKIPYFILVVCGITILYISVMIGVKMGQVSIPFKDTILVILDKVFNIKDSSEVIKTSTINIIWKIRLPRVLLAGIVGANLALAGVGVQTLTKNPLANPFLIGVSSGASAGAVFVMLFGVQKQLGTWGIILGAGIGALLAVTLVLTLVKLKKGYSSVYLVLTGFAVSSFFLAITNLMVFSAKNTHAVRSALFWMTGNFAGAKWEYVWLCLTILIVGILFFMFAQLELDALVLGENQASMLGVNTVLYRRLLIIVSTLMTAAAVSVSGVIGFVGLIIPHVVRMMVGSKHSRVVPMTVLLGASFMILADLTSRMIFSPEEVPIGVVTSLIGAPFFIWMMYKSSYKFGG